MGRTHAEAVRRADDAELVAVAQGSRAEGLAKRYDVAWEADAAALLRRPDVDAVIISTPHHLHADAGVAAMQAGKHVLIEKPLATTLVDCDRLAEAATAHDRVLAVGYHQRFRYNNRMACDWIRNGRMGKLTVAQVSMPMFASKIQTGGFGGDWAWWNDPKSVGHLFNSVPHAIDLLRWFTGTEVATVSAFCRTLLPDVPVEDTTLTMFEMSGGTMGSLFSSRALPAPSFPGEDFRFRLMGESGLLDLDPTHQLLASDAAGWRTIATQARINHEGADTAFGDVRMQAYRDQISAFIDAVRGIPSEVGRWADGRAGVAACVAMLESSDQRRWVSPMMAAE